MKPIVFFFTVLLNTLISFSQEIIYTSPQEPIKKGYFNNVIGANNDYFFARIYYTFDFVYEKYSCKSGELMGTINGEGGGDQSEIKYDFKNYFINENGLNFYGTNLNKKENKFVFYYFHKDFTATKNKLITSSEFEIPEGFQKNTSYFFEVSSDSKKYLTGVKCFNKKKNQIFISFELFDNDFNKLFTNSKVYNDSKRGINIAVDDDGSIFYGIVSLFEEYSVISFDGNRDFNYWETTVNKSFLEKKEIVRDIKFTSNKNNDLIITGLVIDEDSKIKSLWYQRYDGFSKELINDKIVNWDDNFENDFIQDKKDSDYNFTENQYFITDDNHLFILSEEHYITTSEVGSTAVTSYVHNYGDMLLFDIDIEGNLIYAGGIKKKNTIGSYRSYESLPIEMRNPGLSSSILVDNEVYVLYSGKEKISSFKYSANLKNPEEVELAGFSQEEWYSSTKDFKTNKKSLIIPMRHEGTNNYKFAIYSIK